MCITIVNDSILNCEKDSYILHQVNCQGVMGSGVAKALYTKYPEVKSEYLVFCNDKKPADLLCEMQIVSCKDVEVVNMFSQLTRGNSYKTGYVYTNYIAVESVFIKLCEHLNNSGSVKIAIPYNMCCGLAGGDWNIIYDLIKKYFSKYKVTIYKL